MSAEAERWLRKRVRVGAGCAPEVTMAEGVVIAYAGAPTITVRDAHGRDSTWMVTLPIDVLGEVPDDELPGSACGGRAVDTVPRSRELRSQIYRWLGMFTAQFSGAEHDHGTLRHLSEQLAQRIEQLPMPIEDKLGEILRGAGIEHPLGLRGVRDLVNQRDGHRERAREAEAQLVELRAMKDRLDEKQGTLGMDAHVHGRELRMLGEIAGDL